MIKLRCRDEGRFRSSSLHTTRFTGRPTFRSTFCVSSAILFQSTLPTTKRSMSLTA